MTTSPRDYLATCQLVGEGDDEGAAVGTWSAYSGSVPSSTGSWNSALSPPTESTASRKSPGAALTVSSDTASPDAVPRQTVRPAGPPSVTGEAPGASRASDASS